MGSYPTKPESKMMVVGRMFIAPLFAAFMGFMGSYIGIQKDISSVSTAITRMTIDINELKKAQEDMYKNKYMPAQAEWYNLTNNMSRMQAEHDEMKRKVDNLSDDFRRYHWPDQARGKK